MVKEIPLTQGKVALVDDENFEYLNQFKWHAHCQMKKGNRKTCYAERVTIDPVSKKRTTHHMHRVILNPTSDQVVDHINGDGLDNRKENLRLLTNRQNLLNRHHKKSSKYPGVCWDNWTQKWVVHLKVGDKIKNLGRYNNEEKAFKVYKSALKEYCDIDMVSELQ